MGAKLRDVETLTPEEWEAIPADYKTCPEDGRWMVLRYDPRYGTVLVPVVVAPWMDES